MKTGSTVPRPKGGHHLIIMIGIRPKLRSMLRRGQISPKALKQTKGKK